MIDNSDDDLYLMMYRMSTFHSTIIHLAKLAHSKQVQRERLFAPIHYATESDISSFHDYTKSQDFISERHMHQTSIMRDSTKLGLHLLIASETNLHPLKFRLWEMDGSIHNNNNNNSNNNNKNKKNSKQPPITYRLTDDLTMKEMKDCIECDVYYIQEFDDILSNMRRRSRHDDDEEEEEEGDSKVKELDVKDDDELRDEMNAFNEVYHDALRDASSLFDELRIELFKSSSSSSSSCEEDQLYNDGEDPVAGCGIGLSNLPLLDLKAFDETKYDELNARLEVITNRVSDALSKCYRDHNTEESLVFIKIYDPQNILSLDAISMSDLSISQSAVIPNDRHNNNNNSAATTSPSSSPQSTDMTAAVFSDEEHDDDDEYGQQQQQQQLQHDEETMNQQTTDIIITTSPGKTSSSLAPTASTAGTTMMMMTKNKKKKTSSNKNDYIPIKYMGSMILSNTITYQALYQTICDFITTRMKSPSSPFHVDFSTAQARAWLEPQNYR